MSKLIKSLLWLIVLFICLGIIYQYIATRLDERKYPPIGKMVDVGGYKLHMIDEGAGSPVVVMDAALGNITLDWSLVQPEIAKFTRVITYDRAGFAWSNASPLKRISENEVQELHAMLHNAQIPQPYILVGHSLGEINVRLFATMYPDEVAGIVLVDSSHELQLEKLPKTSTPWYLKPKIAEIISNLGIFRFMNYVPSQKRKYSADVQKMYDSQKLTTKFIHAVTDEMAHLKDSFHQLQITGGSLGDKPLTVISAGKKRSNKGNLPEKEFEQMIKNLQDMQKDLVTKSARGKQIIAEKSGHMVNYDQPEIIVDAVREMVDELRSK